MSRLIQLSVFLCMSHSVLIVKSNWKPSSPLRCAWTQNLRLWDSGGGPGDSWHVTTSTLSPAGGDWLLIYHRLGNSAQCVSGNSELSVKPALLCVSKIPGSITGHISYPFSSQLSLEHLCSVLFIRKQHILLCVADDCKTLPLLSP